MSEMTPAQAAAELAAGAARLVEAPAEGEQPEPQAAELPSLEADTTGIEDILEETPEDEVVEDEEEPVEEPDDVAYDYEDPDKTKARVAKLEKKLRWSEEQRVAQGRKNWVPEAKRRFPLADVEEIAPRVTSRRQMLIKAKESHERTARRLEPIISQLKQTDQEALAAVREQQRDEEAGRWGPPSAGPQQPLVERAEAAVQTDQALDRRRYGGVQEMVKARFTHDPRYKEGI